MSSIEHCFANIISSGCAGFKYFPEAGKHALHPPPHLRGVPKTNSGAGLPQESGAGFLRAEAREHDDKIRDIQSADEKADPAFEPALHERRDERTCAHDKTRRNVQQHALPLDRQRLAEDERAQRHDKR